VTALEHQELAPCPAHGDTTGVLAYSRDLPDGYRFYCDPCVLFFRGTTSEWDHYAPTRAHRAELQRKGDNTTDVDEGR
jgi:hypothetical protein